MQEIVWQIVNGGKVSKEKIDYRFPYLECATAEDSRKTDFQALPSPRLIKSHLHASAIPKGCSENSRCKYIYVARNPKDVVVSYFHYVKNEFRGPWEFYVDLFIEGNGELKVLAVFFTLSCSFAAEFRRVHEAWPVQAESALALTYRCLLQYRVCRKV